jgi:hypothetical protein
MEIKFTLKIKDEKNPPVFSEMGKGVLQTIVVDFKGATEDDLKNNPMLWKQIHEMMDQIIEDWIEVKYEKV